MIIPALRELMMCRRLEVSISWSDLQDMPEEMVQVWEAIAAGEAHAHKVRAAHG